MQKFYIHKDNQQLGPFSIVELRDLNITRDTMVWYEGAENWKKAIEIEELKEIFKSIPPPLETSKSSSPPPLNNNIANEERKVVEEKKIEKKGSKMLFGIIAFILAIGIGAMVYSNQQAKSSEIQRQLDEQRIKIQEQENIEAARIAEEERIKREAELEALNYEYNQAIIKLKAANIHLEDIKKFKLLRTASEKQAEVESQLEVIRSWEMEVDRLKKEIQKY